MKCPYCHKEAIELISNPYTTMEWYKFVCMGCLMTFGSIIKNMERLQKQRYEEEFVDILKEFDGI